MEFIAIPIAAAWMTHDLAEGVAWAPPQRECNLTGAAVMIHGQGDHAARYEEILTPFRERGITCFATDLPGHGGSTGRRGEIPGLPTVDAIVARDLERARTLCPDGPIGLLAHSVGGLLALRELLEGHHARPRVRVDPCLLAAGHLTGFFARLFSGGRRLPGRARFTRRLFARRALALSSVERAALLAARSLCLLISR